MANKQTYIGEFEQFVMLSILQLSDNAYGVTIRNHLKESIDRDVSFGALYSTIDRLEKKGLVVSKKGEASPERGGKAKRLVRVSSEGISVLRLSKLHLETMWKGTELSGKANA